MKRILAGLTLMALVVALLAAPTSASADPRFRFHRGGGGGHFVGGLALGALTGVIVGGILASRPTVVYEPAPVYVPPAPVYVQPAPVYVQPAPVYVQPAPVYVQPAPVYVQPIPVYVQPTPVYAAPQPACADYWVPDGYRGGVWVQGHWERACQ